MGAGLHALVGVSPEVGKHIHTMYVTPTLIHGLEALILSTTDFKELEDSYRTSLRYIQHLPMSTAKPAIYLLLGCPPVEAQVHMCMLTFFGKQ